MGITRQLPTSRTWRWILVLSLLLVVLYVVVWSTVVSREYAQTLLSALVLPKSALQACRERTVLSARARHECVHTWTRGHCCPPLPALRLVATGNRVVSPRSDARFANATCAEPMSTLDASEHCVAPPPFYAQYTNAYATDFNFGVSILADSHAEKSTLLAVRATVNRLLDWCEQRAMPGVRTILSGLYVRVAVLSCRESRMIRSSSAAAAGGAAPDSPAVLRIESDWSSHPEAAPGVELGGAARGRPTTGVEEILVAANSTCYRQPGVPRRLDVAVEEFFHTIHVLAMQFADPDAFDTIVCLSVRDTRSGLFNPGHLPPGRSGDERVAALMAGFQGDWKETVSTEYFIGAVAIWLGSPNGEMLWDGQAASREILKRRSPEVTCLLLRYFPDVGQTDGNFCTTGSHYDAASDECRRYPGSCFCAAAMTADYLGDAFDTSKCPSLLDVKRATGLVQSTLPGTAADVKCDSCRAPGCGNIFS